MPNIDTKSWGERIWVRPFSGPGQNTHIEISAEVTKPTTTSRNPTVKFSFTGVPATQPIGAVEMRIFANALQAVIAEVDSSFQRLKPKRKTAKKKPKV